MLPVEILIQNHQEQISEDYWILNQVLPQEIKGLKM